MTLNNNTKYWLSRWGVVLFAIPLMLFGFIAAVRRGQYLMPAVVAVVFVLVLLLVWNSRRQAVKFFRDSTPDRAVAYYRRTMPQAPDGTALSAYMCGLTLTLYGEYDRARDELAEVSWARYPPMYDGFRTYVLSIIALLERKDFRKALDLALESRDLCEVSAGFPGSATSKRSFDAHVLACELLAGQAGQEGVEALEVSVKKLSGIAPAVPLWSLAQYYNRTGQKQLADTHLATLHRLLPNCKPLLA